jgi:hypothetical protein
MVIVMITGDFLSMSLTTDKVRPSRTPNAWRIGNLTTAGVIMGICLLAFCSGVLAVGKFEMGLGIDALRTLAFVVLVFGSQATLYAVRQRRHLWGTRPSLWLAVSSVADIGIASTLAIGGIAMRPLPALLVAGTIAAAAVFAFVLDFVKVPVFARLGITRSRRYRSLTYETRGIAKTEGIPMTDPSTDQHRASSESRPEAKAEPKPEAKAESKPEVKAEPEANTDVATLMNTTLGDVLLAGLAKDPENVGRIVAAAITQAEASSVAANVPKAHAKPDAKAEPPPDASAGPQPETKAEPKPEAKAKTSPDSTPKIAK